MFSLRNPQSRVEVYTEWIVFVALLCGLLALWWVLEFGLPQKLLSRHAAQNYSVPEQVINSLLAGNAIAPQVPKVVLKTLAEPDASKNAASPAPDIPQKVVAALSAQQ